MKNAQEQQNSLGRFDSAASGRFFATQYIGYDAEPRWSTDEQTNVASSQCSSSATDRSERSVGPTKEKRRATRRSRFELPALAHSGNNFLGCVSRKTIKI